MIWGICRVIGGMSSGIGGILLLLKIGGIHSPAQNRGHTFSCSK